MEPLFFGEPGRQLFGVYEPPVARARKGGVVLCCPLVQECSIGHFALRRLAGLLAREGLHVFRFDWSGTGDSAGDIEDADVTRWCSDLRQAVGELADLAGVRRVSAVGLRFGGAIAAVAASGGLELADLVLWDPPLGGRDHLEAIRAFDRQHRLDLPYATTIGPGELLGYALSLQLRASIESVDLAALAPCRADRLFVFAPERRSEHGILGETLRDRHGRGPHLAFLAEEAAWRPGAAFVPSRTIQAIASAVASSAT